MIYVDPARGSDTNMGSFEEPYKTISEALRNGVLPIVLVAGDYITDEPKIVSDHPATSAIQSRT
jgi:hypothetical protein